MLGMKGCLGLRGNQGMRDKKGIQGIGKWFELVDEYKQEVIQFAMLQVQPKQMKSSPRQVPISCRNVFNTRLLQENFQSGQQQALVLVYIPKLALLFCLGQENSALASYKKRVQRNENGQLTNRNFGETQRFCFLCEWG